MRLPAGYEIYCLAAPARALPGRAARRPGPGRRRDSRARTDADRLAAAADAVRTGAHPPGASRRTRPLAAGARPRRGVAAGTVRALPTAHSGRRPRIARARRRAGPGGRARAGRTAPAAARHASSAASATSIEPCPENPHDPPSPKSSPCCWRWPPASARPSRVPRRPPAPHPRRRPPRRAPAPSQYRRRARSPPSNRASSCPLSTGRPTTWPRIAANGWWSTSGRPGARRA